MITPKEKADELCGKYYNRIEHTLSEEYTLQNRFIIKQCALIAVNEMIEIRNEIINTLKLGALDIEVIAFLEEVKQEIENL
jgi:hypothetical protein